MHPFLCPGEGAELPDICVSLRIDRQVITQITGHAGTAQGE